MTEVQLKRVVIVMALVLVGCGEEPTGTNLPTTAAPVSVTITDTTGADDSHAEVPPEVVNTDLEAIVLPILADAAQRAGVPQGDLKVIGWEAVDWPDASLGCPQPGFVYPQVVTPGFKIEVGAGDVSLDYRSDRRGAFTLCP